MKKSLLAMAILSTNMVSMTDKKNSNHVVFASDPSKLVDSEFEVKIIDESKVDDRYFDAKAFLKS